MQQSTIVQTLPAPQSLQSQSSAIMQRQPKSVGSLPPPILQGRVIERFNRFAALPADLQQDTKQFQAFAEQNKHMLFETNHHALVIPVHSVKGEALVNAIIQWLQERAASLTTGVPKPPAGMPAGEAWQATREATAARKAEVSAQPTPQPTIARGTVHVSSELLNRAKQIAEALVLSGFISPYKEDETHLQHLKHYVHDNELFVPVGKYVTDRTTTSVWSVIDGATYARSLKRKAGILAPFTEGQDVYVVFNGKNHVAYLFESDVARELITGMPGELMSVQYDTDHFEFGVRVALNSGLDRDKTELFNAGTKYVQEEFVNAWLSIGARYQENDVKGMLKADARGLVGPEATHNAKWNLTTRSHEIPTADAAAAEVAGITPINNANIPVNHTPISHSGGVGPSKHVDHPLGGQEAQPHEVRFGDTATQKHQGQPPAAHTTTPGGGAGYTAPDPPKTQDRHFAAHETPTAP
jgi:hypothetical protein